MNLVRLHYADGTVESFRPSGPLAVHNVDRRRRFGFEGCPVVAITDAFGVIVGEAISPALAALSPRWSRDVHAAERMVRNMAAVRAEEREALVGYQPASFLVDEKLEEPFEQKADAAWIVLAIAGALVLAGMIATAIASAGA